MITLLFLDILEHFLAFTNGNLGDSVSPQIIGVLVVVHFGAQRGDLTEFLGELLKQLKSHHILLLNLILYCLFAEKHFKIKIGAFNCSNAPQNRNGVGWLGQTEK